MHTESVRRTISSYGFTESVPPTIVGMLYRFVVAASLLLGADALRLSAPARVSTVSMGLSVGSKFPASALETCGVRGKKAVIFFFGADDAPSCSKEISAFEAASGEFKEAGITVVGVRNAAGVKDGTDASVKLVVDEGDEMRETIGIEKDLFGLLGGRETYVLDSSGTVVSVHNSQFDPASHVTTAIAAIEEMPKSPVDELLAQIQDAVSKIGA